MQEFSVRRAQPEDAFEMHHVHVTSVRTQCAGEYTPRSGVEIPCALMESRHQPDFP